MVVYEIMMPPLVVLICSPMWTVTQYPPCWFIQEHKKVLKVT